MITSGEAIYPEFRISEGHFRIPLRQLIELFPALARLVSLEQFVGSLVVRNLDRKSVV